MMSIDFLALAVLELDSWVYRETVVRKMLTVFLGRGTTGPGAGQGLAGWN